MRIQPGFYIYVGSARGPGGLRARVGHHLQPSKRLHWHIDYLRPNLRLEQIWYCYTTQKEAEHDWARRIKDLSAAPAPVVGFGSSDCGCESHLYFFSILPSLRRLSGCQPESVVS